MKAHFLLGVWRQLQRNPKLLRRLMIAGGLFSIGLLLISGVIIWVGYSLVSKTITSAGNINFTSQVQQIKEQASNFKAVPCANAAVDLIQPTRLLGSPFSVHLETMKAACFESKLKPRCDQWQCEPESREFKDESII